MRRLGVFTVALEQLLDRIEDDLGAQQLAAVMGAIEQHRGFDLVDAGISADHQGRDRSPFARRAEHFKSRQRRVARRPRLQQGFDHRCIFVALIAARALRCRRRRNAKVRAQQRIEILERHLRAMREHDDPRALHEFDADWIGDHLYEIALDKVPTPHCRWHAWQIARSDRQPAFDTGSGPRTIHRQIGRRQRRRRRRRRHRQQLQCCRFIL